MGIGNVTLDATYSSDPDLSSSTSTVSRGKKRVAKKVKGERDRPFSTAGDEKSTEGVSRLAFP